MFNNYGEYHEVIRVGIEGISGLRSHQRVSEIPVFKFNEWQRIEFEKDHHATNVLDKNHYIRYYLLQKIETKGECEMTNKKVQPIKPTKVIEQKKKTAFPDVVLESFNLLITQNFSHGSAVIQQDDILTLLIQKGLNRQEIFNKHWLDVEDVYRAEGWHVEYDKPGYNETYPATFTFKRPKKTR
jgi:hypothetical protein